MKIYKVQDMKTGMFSCGGYYPRWTKTGKTWRTLGSVKSHLKMLQEDQTFLVVIEYELVKVDETPATALLPRKK